MQGPRWRRVRKEFQTQLLPSSACASDPARKDSWVPERYSKCDSAVQCPIGAACLYGTPSSRVGALPTVPEDRQRIPPCVDGAPLAFRPRTGSLFRARLKHEDSAYAVHPVLRKPESHHGLLPVSGTPRKLERDDPVSRLPRSDCGSLYLTVDNRNGGFVLPPKLQIAGKLAMGEPDEGLSRARRLQREYCWRLRQIGPAAAVLDRIADVDPPILLVDVLQNDCNFLPVLGGADHLHGRAFHEHRRRHVRLLGCRGLRPAVAPLRLGVDRIFVNREVHLIHRSGRNQLIALAARRRPDE